MSLDKLYLLTVLVMAVAGLIFSLVLWDRHPARVVGPVLRHIGFGFHWAMSQQEIREEISGTVLSWEMIPLFKNPSRWERFKNALTESRVDYRPEGLRFVSSTQIVITAEATARDNHHYANVVITFPPYLRVEENVLRITLQDRRGVTRNTEYDLAEEILPLELLFEKREFPLTLVLTAK